VREPGRLSGNIAQGTHPECKTDGKPTESVFEHGCDGSDRDCEAKRFEGPGPRLRMDRLVAEVAAGWRDPNARIAI